MIFNKHKFFKSVVYRIISTATTFIIATLITGNIKLALTVGFFDTIFKLFDYYFFEIIWDKIFLKKLTPQVIFMTGLSGSGKSTIAESVKNELESKGIKSIVLDGDQIRNVFKNNAFDYESRRQHNLSVANMASLFEKNGHVVIVSLISPYTEVRNECRALCKNFKEVFINASLDECIKRDVKGLYQKAMRMEIDNFTGISAPYENPINPELILNTDKETINESTSKLIKYVFDNDRKIKKT